MPDFFPFIQDNASNSHADNTTPLLGRFRAVPSRTRRLSRPLHPHHTSPPTAQQQQQHYRNLLASGGRGSVHVGYGALVATAAAADSDDNDFWGDFDDDDEDDEDGVYGGGGSRIRRVWRFGRRVGRAARRDVEDLWVAPRQSAVKRVVESWWSRWGFLVFLPAALAVAWCALPFPQYPLDASQSHIHANRSFALPPSTPTNSTDPPSSDHRAPGHGEARIQINFWFFLFVYYGFYNLTALIWITKVFNLYSLNWWPSALGFPLTISLIAVLSLAAPVPVYLHPATRFLTVHNTAWISWTFVIMAMPVAIAFGILMTHERHLGLRHSLSETQRIFTTSWWTGGDGDDTLQAARASRNNRARNRRTGGLGPGAFDPDAVLQVGADQQPPPAFMQRRRWLPASFVRFVWFCLALIISLLAYVIGEAYAEIYLRTLPHNNFETIVYVYSWIVTVHLLDALTGWILGASEGERVGSYPLSWIFKLYFMLTYQTYVRALYARLRSPSQFIWLQALSSSFLIVLTPITMTRTYHRALTFLGMTGQSYGSYQKICTRNVFIRFLAENVSMLAFLGSILVLHFGPNKDVYPYFAFDFDDDDSEQYDFKLTFYASMITWACELAAGIVLRGLIRWFFGVNANVEGKMDLAVWPELLPTSVAVMLHVLQNMLFSIIRLHFR
ncbi:Uu.00g031460.m01.CDS01 [Anthostomella pinea]|uniref:Uu.00g031460.m01.CDS01 n=1 Tax=Anthostomella pinea TaxID=933095 RepID=A0AAI8V8J1_9PEZI|nr:Uu.00g031460.m01.CDS01 [Anthostomella pinea]